jgi:hypothetical protein
MCVQRNIDARACEPFLQWKSNNIILSMRVFVALVIQHAMRVRHIVICGLSGFTVFFYIISQKERLKKEKNAKYVFIFSRTLSASFRILKRIG